MRKHQYGDAPVDSVYVDKMTEIMRLIDAAFNGEAQGSARKTAVVMMIFPFGDEGRCNFMSNGVDRRDLITLMKEMIARFEGQPEMKGRA